MEHACLRGHLDVTDLLLPKNEKLLYDMYHQENNLPRIPSLAASPVLTGSDDGTVSTSSIDKLPEPQNTVNQFYKQLKNNSSNNVSRSTSPKRNKRYKPVKSLVTDI